MRLKRSKKAKELKKLKPTRVDETDTQTQTDDPDTQLPEMNRTLGEGIQDVNRGVENNTESDSIEEQLSPIVSFWNETERALYIANCCLKGTFNTDVSNASLANIASMLSRTLQSTTLQSDYLQSQISELVSML